MVLVLIEERPALDLVQFRALTMISYTEQIREPRNLQKIERFEIRDNVASLMQKALDKFNIK